MGVRGELLCGFGVGADLLPAARALLWIENFFAETDGFRRDLDELVVRDEFDGLLEAQLAVRQQSNGLVGARRAHVGLFFFFRDVYVHVRVARVFSHDHAFIHFLDGADEQLAALLYIPQRERSRESRAIGHQRAGRPRSHFAAIFGPALKQRVKQRGAARIGEQLSPQASTRNTSVVSESVMRNETLVSNSFCKRARRSREVTHWPSRPARGLLFMVKFIASVGSSMTSGSSGIGFAMSVRLSPI